MSQRRLFLDSGIGERRGVVTLEGRPERLLIHRDGDLEALRLGARLAARVRKVEPAFASAFLDLGGGLEAMTAFKPDARPVEGQLLEVEIRTEPRSGKLATVRILGPSAERPGLLEPAPPLADQLRAMVRDADIVEGRRARDVADEAEAEVLQTIHDLPGGGDLAIEPTRALVAIDVDLGERKGSDAKRITRQANMAALSEAARLLRLKALGGIVVLDLVGRGHDATALVNAARTAFAPDNPGVAIGPVSKFGTMEMTIPRRTRPVAEILGEGARMLSDQTLALRMIRRLQDEAAAQGGARFIVRCPAEVARSAEPYAALLAQRIGARFVIQPEAGMARDAFVVGAA